MRARFTVIDQDAHHLFPFAGFHQLTQHATTRIQIYLTRDVGFHEFPDGNHSNIVRHLMTYSQKTTFQPPSTRQEECTVDPFSCKDQGRRTAVLLAEVVAIERGSHRDAASGL